MRYSPLLIFFLIITASSFSQTKQYNIGILLDKNSTEINGILDELANEITAVVGEDAILKFPETSKLVNNFDGSKALSNYNLLLQNDTDIIIAFGIVNNAIISKIGTYPKPTIAFGALSEELISNETMVSNIKNYTSITTSQSYAEDLNLLKKLANPKTVGVIIEKAFTEHLPIAEIFDGIGSELDLEMDLILFDNLSDIITNLDDIDAVYLAGGFYLSNAEIKELADVLIAKKMPSFTANPIKDVKNGILASNNDQSELNQFFRRIALTVEYIVNGDELSGLSSKLKSKSALTVNYNTAEKIGLPIKYSLIATTSFIGNPKEKEAAVDKTYNLVSVMQEAIANNLELQTVQRDTTLAQKEIQFARSDYLPNVTAGATGNYVDPELAKISNGQSPELATSGNITLEQTLFSEAANANISIQKSLKNAQKENYNSDALNTVFSTATAYFTALILKANLSIQSKNLELTKYNLKIAKDNYQAGQSGKSDVLRFRSEKARNTQEMVEAINQLQQGYYTLNQLLNNPIDTKIRVEDAELREGIYSNYNYEQLGQFLDDPKLRFPFVDFLVQEAMKNAPELKALEYNLEATERSERLFGAGRFLPTVGLQGQYYYEFSRSGAGTDFIFGDLPQSYYTVGLNVSLPIFNQNKQNLNKQIASIQKEQLEISTDNVKLNIEKNINDSVLELVNQISLIQLSKVFVETAKEALDLTQTSYASGAVNIVQLLDAQNNYLQAELASTTATYNYLQSSIQLERSLGLFFLLQDQSEREAFIQRFLEFAQNTND